MARNRLIISDLMIGVLLVAVGFAALRSSTVLWSSLLFTFTIALLCFASVVALLRRGRAGGTMIGVVVFGWPYFICTALQLLVYQPNRNGPPPHLPMLHTLAFTYLRGYVNPSLSAAKFNFGILLRPDLAYYDWISGLLGTLTFAFIGGWVGRCLAKRGASSDDP
jgi:hypothetical protein